MKAKSLYPIIISENTEETIKFYCSLGFEKKHDIVTGKGTHVFVLQNGDMEIEVMELVKNGPVEMKEGLYGFRMNVDNIDEAYNELKETGCNIITPPFSTPFGQNMIIQDAQGVNITLIEHKK